MSEDLAALWAGDKPPKAVIKQTGRWRYRIAIHHGLLEWGSWHAWSPARAERKAQRKLTRYLNNETRSANRWSLS